MRIYVAAQFEEKTIVRDAYAKLRAAGHTISHDWTSEDQSTITPSKRDDYLAKRAELDIEGVQDAEVLILFPHERGKGLYVELGVALATTIPVICVAEETPDCIFLKVEDVRHVNTIEQAIELLERNRTVLAGLQ